jgi:hypothetical protein
MSEKKVNEVARAFSCRRGLALRLGDERLDVDAEFSCLFDATGEPIAKLHVIDFWVELHPYVTSDGERLHCSRRRRP